MTLDCSPEQAQYLADALETAAAAQRQAAHILRTLTMGRVPHGLVLADVNVQTGVLTFTETRYGDSVV